MVTKVTDATGRTFINIVLPGTEADYTATMKALIVAMASMSEGSKKQNEARQTLAMLLEAMIPCESHITLPENANSLTSTTQMFKHSCQ